MIKKEQLQALLLQYPIGTRIEFIRIDDPAAPPIGTKGTVTGIDDIEDILVDWNKDSGLNVVPEANRIKKSVILMADEIHDAILKVRATRRTNMFDIPPVQRIAYEIELCDPVLWLEEHRNEYIRFVLTVKSE